MEKKLPWKYPDVDRTQVNKCRRVDHHLKDNFGT